MAVPILPIKKNKLYFCNGTYTGVYWFEEILLFLNNGGVILEFICALVVEDEDFKPYIKDFVSDLEEFRNNELRGKYCLENIIGKFIINSLYGRFGMVGSKTSSYFSKNRLDTIKKNVLSFTILENGYYLINIKHKLKALSHSNILIASATTSKARVKLYQGFLTLLKIGLRLLYCDTDSIFVAANNLNYHSLLDRYYSDIIFKSSQIDTVFHKAIFALPKTYYLIGYTKYPEPYSIIRIKGWVFDTRLVTFEEFSSAFFKNTPLLLPNKGYVGCGFSIAEKVVTYTINFNKYDKRFFKNHKLETNPVNINDII